jgi:hypothetical protein
MMMNTTFISLMALGVVATMAGPANRALAGEPMVLSDSQLDQVTAAGRKGGSIIVYDPMHRSGGILRDALAAVPFLGVVVIGDTIHLVIEVPHSPGRGRE